MMIRHVVAKAIVLGSTIFLIAQAQNGGYSYYYRARLVQLSPSAQEYAVKFVADSAQSDYAAILDKYGLTAVRYVSPAEKVLLTVVTAPSGLKDRVQKLSIDPAVESVMPVLILDARSKHVATNRFVVNFRDNVSLKEIQELNLLNGATIVENSDIWLKQNRYLMEIPWSQQSRVFEVARTYGVSSLVEYAEPSLVSLNTEDDTTPTDTYYSNQWALPKISAPKAWDITQGSSSIIVAVIDNGMNLAHPDFHNKLVAGRDIYAIPHDDNPTVEDGVLHGTACSGIIGARTNNDTGVAGLAWNCKIMPIRASSYYGMTSDNLAESIDWAAQNGAHVISVSHSGLSYSQDLEASINNAATYGRGGKGCVIVFSSGNDGSASVGYPSGLTNVIAVGATIDTDVKWSYSNYGSELDVMAPGGSSTIWTTGLTGYVSDFGGTSASCPHVAALAALILSQDNNLTKAQVQEIIEKTADKVSGMNGQDFTNDYGWGRINAWNAVRITTSGSLPGNEAWRDTVTLIGDVTVPSGTRLTVMAGSTVNLNGNAILVSGGLVTVESGANLNCAYLVSNGSTVGYYSTIQSAINAAASGQTVQLQARAYSENPSFSSRSSITLLGLGQGSTTLSGSVSVTNSSYISISGMTMSGNVYISNSSNTNVSEVSCTGTSMVADYGGTNIEISAMSASSIGASQGVYSYGGTGDITSSSISNGDCGVMLVNNATYNVGTGNYFCGNGYDIYASGGGYAYAISNTYSRALPGAVYGNVFTTGINLTCGADGRMYATTEAGILLDDINQRYLELLQRISAARASGRYAPQNYVSEFASLLADCKSLVKPGLDKSTVIAALSKVSHIYKDMGDKPGLVAYVSAALQTGALGFIEPYLKRYLIWDLLDNKQFEDAMKLADMISSSSAAGGDLVAEMLYEKGLISKHYLNDPKRANEMFTALIASYPSNPLSKFASSTMSPEMRSVINTTHGTTKSESKKGSVEFSSFPNPFNPAILIRFSMPTEGQVRLRVFDMLGKEVAMLLDGALTAGAHQVRFDGSSLPSGVYICRLEVDGNSFVQRMLLLK